MKKIVFVLFVLTAVILSSCGRGKDLPPDPAHVTNFAGKAATSTVPPGAYGPPTDVFDGNKIILALDKDKVELAVGVNNFDITATVTQSNGYVWKKGYYLGKDGEWQEFSYPGQGVADTDWIPATQAQSKTLSLVKGTHVGLGDNYILSYSCKKYSGKWKCGCQSAGDDRTSNKWMLITYILTQQQPGTIDTLPPNPPPIPTQFPPIPVPESVSGFTNINEPFESDKPVLKLNGSDKTGALTFEVDALQTKLDPLFVQASGDIPTTNTKYYVWNKYYVSKVVDGNYYWDEKTLTGKLIPGSSSWLNGSSLLPLSSDLFARNINELEDTSERAAYNYVAVYTCDVVPTLPCVPLPGTFGCPSPFRCGCSTTSSSTLTGCGKWRVFGYKHKVSTPPPPGSP